MSNSRVFQLTYNSNTIQLNSTGIIVLAKLIRKNKLSGKSITAAITKYENRHEEYITNIKGISSALNKILKIRDNEFFELFSISFIESEDGVHLKIPGNTFGIESETSLKDYSWIDFEAALDLLNIKYSLTLNTDKERKYNLHIISHSIQLSFVNNLNNRLYELYKEQIHVDFTIICKNETEIKCHYIVLRASKIPYFDSIFNNNFKESNDFILNFKEYSFDVISSFIDYIYLGGSEYMKINKNISYETLESLLELSDYIRCEELFNIVSLMIHSNFYDKRDILELYKVSQKKNSKYKFLLRHHSYTYDEFAYDDAIDTIDEYFKESFVDELELIKFLVESDVKYRTEYVHMYFHFLIKYPEDKVYLSMYFEGNSEMGKTWYFDITTYKDGVIVKNKDVIKYIRRFLKDPDDENMVRMHYKGMPKTEKKYLKEWVHIEE